MDNKLAVIAIVVEDYDQTEKVNELLHVFRDYIVGRLGVPYKQKGVSVISIILDAPMESINSLSGKLGMIKGISSKVLLTK